MHTSSASSFLPRPGYRVHRQQVLALLEHSLGGGGLDDILGQRFAWHWRCRAWAFFAPSSIRKGANRVNMGSCGFCLFRSMLQTKEFYKQRISYLLHNLLEETQTHLRQTLTLVYEFYKVVHQSQENSDPSLHLEARLQKMGHDFAQLRNHIRELEAHEWCFESGISGLEGAGLEAGVAKHSALFGLASALWTNASSTVRRSPDQTR